MIGLKVLCSLQKFTNGDMKCVKAQQSTTVSCINSNAHVKVTLVVCSRTRHALTGAGTAMLENQTQ